MGPWTGVASRWFEYKLPQIGSQRAHSVVMRPVRPVTAHALFVQYTDECGKFSPYFLVDSGISDG